MTHNADGGRQGGARVRIAPPLWFAGAVVVHCTAVLPEERYLEEEFGAAYQEYRSRVRRYL